jgi:hypothetical protein
MLLLIFCLVVVELGLIGLLIFASKHNNAELIASSIIALVLVSLAIIFCIGLNSFSTSFIL